MGSPCPPYSARVVTFSNAEYLSNIKSKKAEISHTKSKIESDVTDDSIKDYFKELHEKINLHSTVNSYAMYFLVFWLIVLSFGLVKGYFKLDDKTGSENVVFSNRIDTLNKLHN